jgi:hypothetical protein
MAHVACPEMTAIFAALAMVVGAFIACVSAALGGRLRDLHPRRVSELSNKDFRSRLTSGGRSLPGKRKITSAARHAASVWADPNALPLQLTPLESIMGSKVPPTPRHRRLTLDERRQLKMASSAHAYVRGSAAQFYKWLQECAERAVPKGPPVWICGDCHAGNLGPLADAKGRIHVQIRDLDQTVIGNPTTT